MAMVSASSIVRALCYAMPLLIVRAQPHYAASLSNVAEAMWEIPAKPHSVLFVAHGCNHAATDFWFPTRDCPHCLGLPEEVSITKSALAAGYAVVAVSSNDRYSRCWSFEVDGPIVRTALTAWRASTGLGALPLVALGASSGGAFVLQLPSAVPCAAVVSQIMAVPPSMLPAKPPPTLFVCREGSRSHCAAAQPLLRRRAAAPLPTLLPCATCASSALQHCC